MSRSDKLKSDICEYLIRQLYVVADVCLDRNYLAIEMLEALYKYDVLVTILKLPDVPNRLKAPVCRTLKTIYVDREPQTVGIYPRYIRKSGQYVLSDLDEKLSNDENPSNLKFALLQQMIFEYLEKKIHSSSNQYDEFSTEIMSLLCSLFSFGFYDSIQQRNELFFSILGILGNRMSASKQAVKTTLQPPNIREIISDPYKVVDYISEFYARKKEGDDPASSEKDISSLVLFKNPLYEENESVSMLVSVSKSYIALTETIGGTLFVIAIVLLATIVVC